MSVAPTPEGRTLKFQIVTGVLSARSGTCKFSIQLARALSSLNATCTLNFLGRSNDWKAIEPQLTGLDWRIVESKLTRALTMAMAEPILRTLWRGAFTSLDVSDVLDSIIDRGLSERLTAADYVLFMNMWAAAPMLLIGRRPPPGTVLYFHESPSFSELPIALRFAFRSYARLLSSRSTLNVAITPPLARLIKRDLRIESQPMIFGVETKHGTDRDGEPFVLLDTRWTGPREPQFSIALAKELPAVRLVMCGSFPDEKSAEEFRERLANEVVGTRLTLLTSIPESQLEQLYATATCYARWGAATGELGSPTGVLQAIGSGCVPVISSEVGLAQLIGSEISQELVVDRNPRSFAAVIDRLVSDREYHRSMAMKVEAFQGRHSWTVYCQHLLQTLGMEVKSRDQRARFWTSS